VDCDRRDDTNENNKFQQFFLRRTEYVQGLHDTGGGFEPIITKRALNIVADASL
jgi:hypothetical protein